MITRNFLCLFGALEQLRMYWSRWLWSGCCGKDASAKVFKGRKTTSLYPMDSSHTLLKTVQNNFSIGCQCLLSTLDYGPHSVLCLSSSRSVSLSKIDQWFTHHLQMVAWPQIQIYVSLYFILCPLYCNTLLANLNARAYIRGESFTTPSIGFNSNLRMTLNLRTATVIVRPLD